MPPVDLSSILTIGEVARRAGVAASALRFYESRGLITSERAESGHRRYPRSVLRRIAFIVFAQRRLSEAFARVAGHDAIVVEPQELDDLPHVSFVLESPGGPAGVIERMHAHFPLIHQVGPHIPREAEVRHPVAVEMPDLSLAYSEGELAPAAWAGFHARPGRNLCDNPVARVWHVRHASLLEVPLTPETAEHATS